MHPAEKAATSAMTLIFLAANPSLAQSYTLTTITDGVDSLYSGYRVGAYASVNPIEGTDAYFGTPGSSVNATAEFPPFGLRTKVEAGPGVLRASSVAGPSSLGHLTGGSASWASRYDLVGNDGRPLQLSFNASFSGQYNASTPFGEGIAYAAVDWNIGGYRGLGGKGGVSEMFVFGGMPQFYSSGQFASTTTANVTFCPKISIAGVAAEIPCLALSAVPSSFQSFFDTFKADVEIQALSLGYDSTKGDSISFDTTIQWNTSVSVDLTVETQEWLTMGVGTSSFAYVKGNSTSNFGSTFKLSSITVSADQVAGLSDLQVAFADGSVMPVQVVPELATSHLMLLGLVLAPLAARKRKSIWASHSKSSVEV